MFKYYKQFNHIINEYGLAKFYFLILLFIFLPFIELLGITSLFGYIQVLFSEKDNYLFATVRNFLNLNNNDDFLLYTSLIVVFLIILRNVYVVFVSIFKTKYFAYLGNFLSAKLLNSYFKQKYSFFLKNNSSILVKNINDETHVFSYGFLASVIDIISSLIVTVTMLTIIFYYNFQVSIITMSILGGFYLIYYYFTKERLLSLGAEKLANNNARFQNVSQSIQGIREIKVFNLEKVFIKICDRYFKGSASILLRKFIISFLPRYIVETLVFLGLIFIIFFSVSKGAEFNSIFEMLSLYILVGYRILPYLEKLFQSVNKIKYSLPTVNLVMSQLSIYPDKEFINEEFTINKIQFKKEIALENIGFSFDDKKKVLDDVNIKINKNNFIAIVGKTGSGKTTLLNIFLGLLEATTGSLSVDGKIIDKKNVKSWQDNLGYVPQDVYIFENSIRNNIVLYNEKYKDIDQKIIEAAKKAEIFDFIESLDQKFDSKIGERGTNLSGGQKQRLAIARALFADPDILIFDEATSNLDNQTASAFIESLDNLKKLDKTVILVTHDVKLTKKFDKIIFLKDGRIHAEGSYQQLNNNTDAFRELISED